MNLARRRTALAIFFVGAGLIHLVAPRVYLGIMPPGLPNPVALIYLSGIAEILGGLGLMWASTRRAAGIGLILLLLAVFPANIQMLVNWRARGAGAVALTILWLRLPLQLIFIWWAWTLSRTKSSGQPADSR